MLAEIIAIGTEIVTGAKLDTNSQWLSLQLGDLGIPTGFHTSVEDSLDANVNCLRIAVDRADVILMTGGLGPTLDDLTREALARLVDQPLELDEESLKSIRAIYESRGRVMPERNRLQALFPRGSQPLVNPIGTAPGIWLEVPRAGRTACVIAALPGVPSEMKRMFTEQVLPRLPASGVLIRRDCVHCYGVGESQADELLQDLTARGRDPEIGITAHEATITLRIEAKGKTEQECADKIAVATSAIRERLGNYVFGTGDDELQDAVFRLLAEQNKTLGVLDAGSGGWLARELGPAARNSPGVLETCLSGDWWAMTALVGADGDSDLAVVAERARHKTGVDYMLAIEALPDLSFDEIRHSTHRLRVAVAGPESCLTDDLGINGNPAILEARIGKTGLDLVRRVLGGFAKPE